jgi:2-hydroxychromene-2-carboxylate isomerase
MGKLDFWFEYGSTYTYLTVARIHATATRYGIEVNWRPFLLAPIMIEQGLTQGPFRPFPKKLHYMWRDLERRAATHGLPYRKPSHYPPNTLLTARVGILAATEGWCREFTERSFALHWTEDCPIGSDGNLSATLKALGKDAATVLVQAQSAGNKERLRSSTEEAKAIGIFGSPSFVAQGELFWGDDRLEDALAWAATANVT